MNMPNLTGTAHGVPGGVAPPPTLAVLPPHNFATASRLRQQQALRPQYRYVESVSHRETYDQALGHVHREVRDDVFREESVGGNHEHIHSEVQHDGFREDYYIGNHHPLPALGGPAPGPGGPAGAGGPGGPGGLGGVGGSGTSALGPAPGPGAPPAALPSGSAPGGGGPPHFGTAQVCMYTKTVQ